MRTKADLEADALASIADAIDHLFRLEIALSGDDYKDTYDLASKLKDRLVWRALWKLAEAGRLVGAELADECGDVYGVVTGLQKDADGYWVMYDRRGEKATMWSTGCDNLVDMATIPEGAPFRPAGSDHYGELGTAALLREYADALVPMAA